MKPIASRLIFLFLAAALLAQTPNPDQKSAPLSDDIFSAIKAGNIAQVKALVTQNKALLKVLQSEYGPTPLLVAAEEGQAEIVVFLLENGADVFYRDGWGFTALHYAQNKGIAELLLKQGAKVNAQGRYGPTALHKAAENGRKDVAELLLAHGADVNAGASSGLTPLHLAKNKEIAELLISKGADVNARANENIDTPLHKAVDRGSQDVVEVLLAKGANPNTRARYYWTPLHDAAWLKSKNIAQLLLAHGADVNARDVFLMTPLHYTAMSGDKTGILGFLGDGPGCEELRRSGFVAYNSHSTSPQPQLTQKQVTRKPADVDMANLLLRHGAEVNARSDLKFTPRGLAVCLGNNPLADFLRQQGGTQ